MNKSFSDWLETQRLKRELAKDAEERFNLHQAAREEREYEERENAEQKHKEKIARITNLSNEEKELLKKREERIKKYNEEQEAKFEARKQKYIYQPYNFLKNFVRSKRRGR